MLEELQHISDFRSFIDEKMSIIKREMYQEVDEYTYIHK